MQDLTNTLSAARKAAQGGVQARTRLQSLFDPGSFRELGALVKNGSDGVGVLTGHGLVGGMPVYAFSQDKTVRHGAVGAAHASKIKKLYDLALKTGAPVVGIFDSNGAAIDEGLDALNAYGELLCWSNNLSGVVPQISLVLGPCIGSASLIATSADFVILGEKAEFFLNAGDAANSDPQSAAQNGVCHILAESDQDAMQKARQLLSFLPENNLSETLLTDYAEPSAEALADLGKRAQDVELAALIPCVLDADSFLPLQEQYVPEVKIGFGRMLGASVGVVAAAQGGYIPQGGCAKIARFVSVCDAFQIPVISFVDAAGFRNLQGQPLGSGLRQIAKLAHVYAEATCPKITLIAGKAYGSVFVALGSRGAATDYTVAWPGAVISPLSPQTAVAFLGDEKITKDSPREKVEEDYAAAVANPFAAAAKGNIDDVIAPEETRATLLSALEMLLSKRASRLPKKHGNIPM